LKLSEILEADSLASARIVAGRDGLEAEVKWSHVVDLPEPLPWVRPGDLLLTTGYSWPKEALEERRLVRQLAAAGVSAIALAVPRFVEAFSDAACDEADRSGLPLLEIPWAVPFAGIMEELHRKIMAEPLRAIERSEAIHRALTRAAGDGSSLDALAELLARLVGRSVTFEDPGGKLLAHASADDDHDEVRRETLARSQSPRALHAEFERRGVAQQIRTAQRHVRVPAIEGLGMGARLACPIRLGKEVVGVVWILEGKTPLNELDQRAAEHAALVAAIRIAHERELESLESRLGYASFLSFLESDSSAPVAEERLRLLGFDPDASHVAGIVALDLRIPLGREELDERDGAAESVRFALARLGAPSLVTVTLDRVPFLVPSGFPLAELAAIVDRPARSLVFGREHAGADGARASYHEARSLLDYHQRPPVCYFDDVLVPRVLTGDVRARDVFLEELFGRLRAQRNGEPLVEALVELARHGFQFRACARTLGVHPNTLRYRLDRATEITGMDVRDPETQFRLQLATRLLDIAIPGRTALR
jgi:purine catabolism regulator